MPPAFAPKAPSRAGTVGVGTQEKPAAAGKPSGKSQAKEGQQQVWGGNGSTSQKLNTQVTPKDIRALSSQLSYKWVAPFAATMVVANALLVDKFGQKLSGKNLDDYRKFLESKLSGEDKSTLREPQKPENVQAANFIGSTLAACGMVQPVTTQVFCMGIDSDDISLIHDVRKVIGIGRGVDQSILDNEGARS